MATAAWPLQVAFRSRMLADAGLTGVIAQRVYDEVPGDAAFPYVTVGDVVEVPDDAHDRQGLTATLTLHIWSRYRGYAEALMILGHLDRLFDRQPLAVDGFTDVSIAREWHQTLRDPDPQIRHVPVRFRAWLTKET